MNRATTFRRKVRMTSAITCKTYRFRDLALLFAAVLTAGFLGLFVTAKPALANNCPPPGADQAVIYQSVNRGDACKVLSIGEYLTSSSFSPVPDNSVSAIAVGSNVRVVLYDDSNLVSNDRSNSVVFLGQTHYEGGWYYNSLENFDNKASSIEVFRMQGGSAATGYLDDYPAARENYYSDNVQGLAHDSSNWFITTEDKIYKVPLTYDLNNGTPHPSFPPVSMPESLRSMGYNHFGDPDVRYGFLFVPIEGGGQPARIAVFRTSDLGPVSSAIVPNSVSEHTGWAAILPGSDTLWTSDEDIGASDGIREYKIDWEKLRTQNILSLAYNEEIILKDRHSVALDIRSMQGGVFNPEGTLFYQVNGYCDAVGGDVSRIRVFDLVTGTLQARSENGYGPFNFENHPNWESCGNGSEEPEGIDFFDVAGRDIPGIPSGQLHVFLLSNDWWSPDDVYLKHYEMFSDTEGPVVQSPTQSLVSGSTLGTSSVPVKLIWSAGDRGGSGISRIELQQSTNGGAYTNVSLPSATATSITPYLAPGSTYRFRVRAQDSAGNWSDWAYGESFAVNAYQETSTAVTYPSGTWTSAALSGAYGGQVKYATACTAHARFTFTGANIALVTTKGPNKGKAYMGVDGVTVGIANLYSATMQARQVVLPKGALDPSKSHTVEVVKQYDDAYFNPKTLTLIPYCHTAKSVDVDAFVTLSN